MSLGTHPHDQRSTRTSTLVVVLAAVAVAGALVRAANVTWPAVVGSVGATTLAVVVWAVGWDRYRTAGSVLASLLLLPVGVGIVAATVGTVLVLAGALFPVPAASQIPETAIRMSARAMVVAGAVTAVFGAATATRGVLDRESVEAAATTASRTTLVPFLAAAVLAGRAALGYLEANAAGPGLQTAVGEVLRTMTGLFFRPELAGPHLPTFVLMVAVALLATQRGLVALPLPELLAEVRDGSPLDEDVDRATRWLFWAAFAAFAALPVAAVVHLALPPRRLRALLGPGVYDLLAAVTTSPGLRSLAWWLTVAGFAVAAVVWLLRRFVRTSTDRIGASLGPFVGGLAITALAIALADRVLTTGLAWVTETLPGEFGAQFAAMADGVVDVYGSTAIVLGVTVAVLLLAGLVVVGLWALLATGYVEGRTAGVTIASLALFSTAAFAGALDVSNALVLASLVGAVLVWDAGEFGVTLGREIGRRADTRRAELVHATGTLAIGGVGSGVALLVADHTLDVGTAGTGPVALGLLAVLGGLILLVAALR